jgi:DNA-binding LytR/AlgR family response regulator
MDEQIKIEVHTRGGKHIIIISDVIYCQSKGRYASICLSDGNSIEVLQNLKQLAELFPLSLFFRCHAKYLINMSKVENYSIKGRQLALAGKIISVAKDRDISFREQFQLLTK